MQKKTILTITLFTIIILKSYSQNQWWYGNFYHICDDREYNSGIAYNQTILAARLDMGRAFEFDSTNQVYAGLNYMFEYGSNPAALIPVPDIYYKYEVKNFKIIFGSFPRKDLLNYPLAVLTDTLMYYRPNIQGGLMEFRGDWGYQNAWCDWTSRQTFIERETFLAGASGHLQHGMLYIEDYFSMYHHAGARDTTLKDVTDNGGGAVYVGIDLKGKTFLDKLSIDFGAIGSYDRKRPAPYQDNYGWQFRVSMFYKRYGIDATYYKGEKLNIAYGDPFYKSGNYARIDTYFKMVKSKHVDSKLGWSFHIANGKLNDNSFQVFFRADFLNR